MKSSNDIMHRDALLRELEALSLRLDLEEAETIASVSSSVIEKELRALALKFGLPQISPSYDQIRAESRDKITSRNEALNNRQVHGTSSSSHSFIVRVVVRFFLFLSNTNIDALQSVHCTKSTGMSRTLLGVMVFLAGVTAFLSTSYALSVTFFVGQSWGMFASLGLGFLYSCMFMTFHREVIGYQEKRAVWIRLPLMMIMGFMVAVPLEVRFFEESIDRQLQVMKLRENEAVLNRRNNELDALERRNKELENTVSHYRAEVLVWENAVEAEKGGRGFTGIVGLGSQYHDARRNREASAGRLSYYETRLKEFEDFAREETKRINANYQAMSIDQDGDFLARFQALNELKATSVTTRIFAWAVTVFFMLIVLFPLLVRLSLPYSEYDALVETRRRASIKLINRICNQPLEESSRTAPIGSKESMVDI